MNVIEQGSILNISGIRFPVIVVSGSFFNKVGCVIVCPIVKTAAPGPLHIQLKGDLPQVSGYYVLCEQVKYIDLNTRHFSKITHSRYFDFMDISDAVMGIFDYQ